MSWNCLMDPIISALFAFCKGITASTKQDSPILQWIYQKYVCNLLHFGRLIVKDFILQTWHQIKLLRLVYWQCLAFKVFLTQLRSLQILIHCVLEHSLCPVLTFQDVCIIVCCGKFQGIIWSCVKAGVFPVVLPTSFPQLTFEHFPVFWVKYCHEFIHTGHRPQLLFQVFACISLSK